MFLPVLKSIELKGGEQKKISRRFLSLTCQLGKLTIETKKDSSGTFTYLVSGARRLIYLVVIPQ